VTTRDPRDLPDDLHRNVTVIITSGATLRGNEEVAEFIGPGSPIPLGFTSRS
jgi:hypothetical protein